MTDRNRDDLVDTENALRRALAVDAGRVSPPERLGAILRDAHQPPLLTFTDEPLRDAPPARRTWLAAGAAAAALIVAVAVGVAVTDRNGTMRPGATGSGTAPTGSVNSSPGTGQTSAPTTPATGTGISSATGDTAVVALPVYYIGTRAGGTSAAALVREFVPSASVGGAFDVAGRISNAVMTALQADGTPYATIGLVQVALSVDAPSASGIVLTLSSDTTKITLTAIQEAAITYTAQAAAGLGDVPVTINLNPHTFGPLGRVGPFTRKSFPDSVLAPIWVDAPYRGQVFSAGRAIAVTGLASVFEAQLAWQVLRGGAVVASGTTTAAQGAPARAAYTISIAALPAGDYTLRVEAPAPKGDGSLAAETTTVFSVG